jgi:hypothetical protein
MKIAKNSMTTEAIKIRRGLESVEILEFLDVGLPKL